MDAFLPPVSGMIRTALVLVLLLFVACKNMEQTSPVDLQKAQNALWEVAKSGDVAALAKAIDEGADVNAIDARTNPSTNSSAASPWCADRCRRRIGAGVGRDRISWQSSWGLFCGSEALQGRL